MIDVIIPTRNRANTLELVLPTYLNQKLLGKIIIIDDASDEENEQLMQKLVEDNPVIIYKRFNQRIFISQARNEGIKLSIADYIFMGEDDVYLENDHLKILFEEMQKYNADLIAGRRIYIKLNQDFEEAKKIANEDKRPIFTKLPFEGYFERFFEKDIIDVPFLHSNSLIKKDVYNKVLYDPVHKGNAFREDLDFFLGCKRERFKIVLTNKTACYHLKDKINTVGGARMERYKYEYWVWKNTIHCFSKNKKVLKEKYGFSNPLIFAIFSLIYRYPYAIYRRLIWKIKKS